MRRKGYIKSIRPPEEVVQTPTGERVTIRCPHENGHLSHAEARECRQALKQAAESGVQPTA
jgi:hypothetical protein